MAESKRRWLALVMAMIMLLSLLPDSFLPVIRVWAENVENNKKSEENETNIIIKFTADEQLDSNDFLFTLYELTDTDEEYEDKDRELTSTDGMYLLPVGEKENSDAGMPAGQSRTAEDIITFDITNEAGNIQVRLKGLSDDRQYVYELTDNQNHYLSCTDTINMGDGQNLPKEKALKALETDENKISLSIAQTISENSINVKYNIYPVMKINADENTEHIFRKQEVKNGEIQQVNATESNKDIKFTFDNLYSNYEIEFYTDNNEILNKVIYIDYDVDTSSYKLADSEDNSLILESFSSNPLTAGLEFTEKVEQKESGTKNIVSIQASTSDLTIEISGADYISKKMPEDAILQCSLAGSWADKNVKLEDSNNKYTLSIPAYFTGEIPILYKLEKENYTSVEKTVIFSVFYEEINKANGVELPDAGKTYSNQKISDDADYRPVITGEDYTFYAIKKEKATETKLTDTVSQLEKGIIVLPESTAQIVYYDIYGVDKNDKIYKSELELNIDTTELTITIDYENGTVKEHNGINYYQGRKAKISFDTSKPDSSIYKEGFRKNAQSLIDSITYENNVISGSSLQLSEKAVDGWYQATNEAGVSVYKISEWNTEEKCYSILFEQNGTYKMKNTTDFTDNYGNAANLIFNGDNQTDFILDNTAPTADWNVLVRTYSENDSSRYFRTVQVGKLNEFITTALGEAGNIPVKTSLENIYDAVSGVNTVECIVTDSQIEIDELKKRTDWTSSVQNDEYQIETVIDNTNKSKSSCTVTFTDKEISKKYYVYYKAADNAGNISFFNELGITLDNKRPEISNFEYTDTNTKGTKESELGTITYFTNANVTVGFKITDENFQINENDDIQGMTVSVNNDELTNLSWTIDENDGSIVTANYFFECEDNDVKSYKIKAECKDKVEIPASIHEETLILDKRFPVIGNYEFYDINNTPLSITNSEMDNDIKKSFIGNGVNTDVKVKLQITEDSFDKSLARLSIEDSEGQPVPVSLDSEEWVEKDGVYENYITLAKKDNEEEVYNITLTCTDKAGNESSHKEILVIDKKAPVITVRYSQNQDENNGGMYYQNRDAVISIDETYSLNQDEFLEAIKKAIKSETELQENELFSNIKWNTEEHGYSIEFIGNTKYNIGKIEYTDKGGNAAGETQFASGTKHGTEFYVDKIAPAAKAQLILYQYQNLIPNNELLNENSRQLYLSTFFQNPYQSQFILSDIKDNLSGVKTVEYYLSNTPIDLGKLSDSDWCSSKDSFANKSSAQESVELKENGDTKTLIVSLPDPKQSSVHYIYYRITDGTTKNTVIINGAGIILDQQDPVIQSFDYQKSEDVKNNEISENGKIVYAFSDNVTIKITIEEENFDTENSTISIEKYNKSEDNKEEYDIVWEQTDWALQDKNTCNYISEIPLQNTSFADGKLFTKSGEANQYKITVTAKDKVGRKKEHSEFVRIDREQPEITVEYDDSNKVDNHYYNGKRTAEISVKKTFQSSVNKEDFLNAVKNGISVKNTANQEITIEKERFYSISGWNLAKQSYTIIYQKDAIYTFTLNFEDKLGNKNKEKINFIKIEENSAVTVTDGNSFVIDSIEPQITISYTNGTKAADYYYKGERTAKLEMTDLSFTYAYYYDEDRIKSEDAKEILFNNDFINLNITAENPFIEDTNSLLPEKSKWQYENGVFKITISYKKDAVYIFGISGKDICQTTIKNIKYEDNKGNKINDGESFVIDASIPVITITYDDSNKKTDDYSDGYYQGNRTAEIEVKDLSLYYAKTTENSSSAYQEYPLTEQYVDWKITAKDIQNNNVEQAYTTPDPDETGWIFHADTAVFHRKISYNKDAIYSFLITSKDICSNEKNGKTADILYKGRKDGKTADITDGESFVIDTEAPVITVTYYDNDTNKLKNENEFVDHYYKDIRTAKVAVSDLSLTYAYRQANSVNFDALMDNIHKEKVDWQISARDAKGNDIQAAYSKPNKWKFSEENKAYIQEIQFIGEAIYEFSLSGSDLCKNTAVVKYLSEEGNKIKDGNSFIIDRTAPSVVIEYNDVNKCITADNKPIDRYYKGSRTAKLTVLDLSYVYEEQQAKTSENNHPELTASRRIPVSISAKDAKNQEVSEAYLNGEWSFSKGSYKKEIEFNKDAIYAFEILKERDNEGILKEASADIYGRTADINYITLSGNEVTDYDSFVISRKNPEVTITYYDNEENKLEDYYYKDTRTAEIAVSDLSYVYEDRLFQIQPDDLVINDRIHITITAEDTKGILEEFEGVSQEAWSFDNENGIYKKTITFDGDAIYFMELRGTNIFGREVEKDKIIYQNEQKEQIKDGTSFVIDREAPEIIIIYDDTNKKTDYYRNHFYAGKRTAAIQISDLSYVYEDRQREEQDNSVYVTADRVKSEITAVNESGANLENTYTISEWSFDRMSGAYTSTVEFLEDAIYSYSIQANDIYGNSVDKESENTITVNYQNINGEQVTDWDSFVIDTAAPIVAVTYADENKGTNTTKQEYTDGYYKDNRTANITVSDLSLVYADKFMPENADTENLVLNETDEDSNVYIRPEILAYSNDTERIVENAHTMNLASLWSWNETQNRYQASITFMAEAAYKFQITGEDICKNAADVSYSDVTDANQFVIDKTAPVISITYNDNTPVRTIDGRGYFARTRTATVVITEGCDTFDREDAFRNIMITARDAAGNDVGADTYTVSGWTESKASENGSATRYTAEITYRGNANYTFAISYMDKTGHIASNINTNGSAAPYNFTVDSAAPTGIVSVSGFGSWNRLAGLLTFDRWSNSAVNITASADDQISSVYSIKYYKTAAVTAMTRQQLLDLNDSLWTDYRAFSVRPDEMFSVYLRIEDRSGNISFINSDGIIVDTTAPNEESIAPEITVAPVQPINNIYNTDVTVDITVTDPIINGAYSGLESIRYEVQNMGVVTQQGQLYTFYYTAGQTLQSQLLQRWNGQIIVDRNLNNSNDVRIVVYAQDNSNNMSSAYTSVQIDVTQPSIDISYDNNNGDASFGTATYFNADRTATIRITERNFNAADVQITITNTDGVIPAVSGWSSSVGTGNGDDAVHTATITYSADGDYVFAISYADLAGNINTAPAYGNSAAPEQFTIDKTLPIINVTYDNNSVQNENYYNAVRTATVSITEHNFDAGRYNITLTASDDGTDKAAPSIGSWSNNGDIHTASVQFTDDGYYSMNMAYTDMAGNQAAQFAQQTFYVDQTMPKIEVRGIRNNTANNDERIGFEITCTDTNFDVFTPQLSVTKMIDGRNVTENCEINQMTPIRNGQTYTVDNLEQDGIYSLTCTARDKAGNVFDRVVYLNDAGQEEDGMEASEGISFLNFSVNRKGSVYMLDAYADEIAKSYYIREVDEDFVIVETNVDTLDSDIELNGNKLVEGTDYQAEISGGNGEWYVVRYIINKALFEEEGEYKIVIHSKDHAGNTAFSDIKGTNMSFIIDKTAPVVTVAGIEDNGRYQVERQTVTVIPKDDGGKLQKITIEAFNQNSDMLEGFPIVYEGEELIALLKENNGELTFELPEGTGMSVRITCEDTAGNEMDVMSFDNIVVSTNRLTIILSDKRVIYGMIAGLFVLIALIVLLIVWKKNRKEKENNKIEEGNKN